MANVIEFTSVANRLGYLAEEPVYTPTGLGLSIVRGSNEGCRNVPKGAPVEHGFRFSIDRDGQKAVEFWNTRAQAWSRAAVMMGRVES